MINYFDLKYQVIDTPQCKKMAIYFEGEMISDRLHTDTLSTLTPTVAQYPFVREYVRNIQRTLANKYDIVMEGRDIGTVVLPDADLKIYLTANAGDRAHRRYMELLQRGQQAEPEQVLKDIIERDYRDMNREVSPLKQADDAVLVDTSDMTIEEVVNRIIEIAEEKGKK